MVELRYINLFLFVVLIVSIFVVQFPQKNVVGYATLDYTCNLFYDDEKISLDLSLCCSQAARLLQCEDIGSGFKCYTVDSKYIIMDDEAMEFCHDEGFIE